MRLGIFGGSFDPIHYGHLVLAEHCREQAKLDEVWFIPSARGPHKGYGPAASARQRIEIVTLAIAGHENFVLSESEIQRGGVSYTLDTLTSISTQRPHDELFLLMGADSLSEFETWREPGQICQLCIPLVVGRPNLPLVDLESLSQYVSPDRLKIFQQHRIESPLIEISSADIRHRVLAGRSIRYLTPRAVERYIQTQNLYREQ